MCVQIFFLHSVRFDSLFLLLLCCSILEWVHLSAHSIVQKNIEAKYQAKWSSTLAGDGKRPHEHLNAESATMLFITIECVADVQKQFEWTNKWENESKSEREREQFCQMATIYAIWCVNMHDHDDDDDNIAS